MLGRYTCTPVAKYRARDDICPRRASIATSHGYNAYIPGLPVGYCYNNVEKIYC